MKFFSIVFMFFLSSCDKNCLEGNEACVEKGRLVINDLQDKHLVKEIRIIPPPGAKDKKTPEWAKYYVLIPETNELYLDETECTKIEKLDLKKYGCFDFKSNNKLTCETRYQLKNLKWNQINSFYFFSTKKDCLGLIDYNNKLFPL